MENAIAMIIFTMTDFLNVINAIILANHVLALQPINVIRVIQVINELWIRIQTNVNVIKVTMMS